MTKLSAVLTIFVAVLMLDSVSKANYCEDYFEIQTANFYYTVSQSYLNNKLSENFLTLKDNPILAAEYLRQQVGFSEQLMKNKSIPYLSKLIPHFLAILDNIPEQNLRALLDLINERKLLRREFKEISSVSHLKQIYIDSSVGISVSKFNRLALLALYFEHIFIWKQIFNQMSDFELKANSDVLLDSLVELDKAYSVGLLPIIVFNFMDPSKFKFFWKLGASPISIQDKIADPYDGYGFTEVRSRFRFALHEVFHLDLLRLEAIPRSEQFILKMINNKRFGWILAPILKFEPRYLKVINKFISKSQMYIDRLENPLEKEFVDNFMWWMLHESDYLATTLSLVNGGRLNKDHEYKRNRMIQELIVGPVLFDDKQFPWILPIEWRTDDINHIRDKINNYLNFVESTN